MLLPQEVIQLHSRLKRKTEQVDRLQYILSESGLDLSTKQTTAASRKRAQAAEIAALSAQLKENVLP